MNDASNSRHQFFTDSFVSDNNTSTAASHELLGYALAVALVKLFQNMGVLFRMRTIKLAKPESPAQKDMPG